MSGVPNERTSLAWSRTALSFAACSLLLGRLAQVQAAAAAVTLALVGVLGSVGLLVTGEARYRRAARRLPAARPIVGPVPIALLTAATVLLGVVALILMLIP
ncbi:hypothetical protein BH20ACT5_BH20ACT5_00780 [soil metagenome]